MNIQTKSPIKPSPDVDESPAAVTANPEPPISSTDAPPPPPAVISIPSYSRWFSWDNIHQCELRHLPEFFDGRTPSKNPKVYKYYRNSIIRSFRDNPSIKLTFTQVRKTIIGDVGSIRRVYDFLESWGLINYTSNSSKPSLLLKWEDKDSKPSSSDTQPPASADSTAPASALKKRLCSACKTICTPACFSSEKHDMILCSRCYVRGNYRVGISSSDFRRVEFNDEVKTEWTDKETLVLLEAVLHHGDDWKKVAARVSGRNEKECIARFVKLPFGEQFVGPPESRGVDTETGSKFSSVPNKRMRLTPLADASNPIMAQAAFLSALVGVEVAEVASQAAVRALTDLTGEGLKGSLKGRQESDSAPSGGSANEADSAIVEAQVQLEKEQEELERAVSSIAVQMKEIHDKLVHFEELDLQVERGLQQLQQLQNSLFNDQLTLIMRKSTDRKTVKSTDNDTANM